MLGHTIRHKQSKDCEESEGGLAMRSWIIAALVAFLIIVALVAILTSRIECSEYRSRFL